MQRNGQNPIKSEIVTKGGAPAASPAGGQARSGGGALRCPSCGAEVPPKPGFRPSSLKCPKCGSPLGKK